jgi:membrane protein YqaA with SNARE-associated domain
VEQVYIDVIVEGVLSTTLWQFTPDVSFFAMLAWGGYDMQKALMCAIVGASIGSCINYGLGRLFSIFQFNGVSVIPQEKYDLWRKRAYYATPIIAIFSWIHLLGALVFGLGFLRVRAIYVLPLLVVGQMVYYTYAMMQATPH